MSAGIQGHEYGRRQDSHIVGENANNTPANGSPLTPLFTHSTSGSSINFYFHESVTEGSRFQLKRLITVCVLNS
jgi:hypothetical protein